MSWEEMAHTERPCACGRGSVLVVHEVDDRNRGRDHTYLRCEYCDSEAKERIQEAKVQHDETLLRLQVLQMEIFTYFDSRYMEHWINHFAFCSSKKAVWEILRSRKIITRGLSTFYEEVKDISVQEYLRNCTSISAMTNILALLEIHDDHLEKQVERAMAMAGPDHQYLITSR